MPTRAKRPCKRPGCSTLIDSGAWCDQHRPASVHDRRRPDATQRGYDRVWKQVRERTLAAAGIPGADWPLWDVDHDPPYDAAVQPDHRAYRLTPRLHADHSRKTATENGGFGNRRSA